MTILSRALFLVGVLAIASGMLFAAQGAGIIHWPPESFMLDERPWIWRGALTAFAGALLIAVRWMLKPRK